MQKRLILLGTQGCHLCEQAEQVLNTLNLTYDCLDIMDSEKLLARYEVSIPVLLSGNTDDHQALGWPFDANVIGEWLNALNDTP